MAMDMDIFAMVGEGSISDDAEGASAEGVSAEGVSAEGVNADNGEDEFEFRISLSL
jgi:hypothetical protein